MPTTGFGSPQKLCKKSSSATCLCRWYSQIASVEDDRHEPACSPSVAVATQLMSQNFSTRVGCHSQFLRRDARMCFSMDFVPQLTYSMAGVRRDGGRYAFTSAVGVLVSVSRRRCCKGRNT